ncbi:hypothetical protein EX30DRAFT_364305 [Ascodesmis nigricans]|uniref:C2H2-type domain-containing protein n=1 Tax=Ascodesmis nigricans TaxID=341454 RepID=A0A4S2MVL1_9PEZI|nr:hypothetical protein EX30DRAFT_364305 [Ascodesmis nigricans]
MFLSEEQTAAMLKNGVATNYSNGLNTNGTDELNRTLRKTHSTPSLPCPETAEDSPLSPGSQCTGDACSMISTTPASPTNGHDAAALPETPTLLSTQRVSRAKKGKRVHACKQQGCGKIFTRAEHLRRHQLNHSANVHYKCDMCDKTFVRQDLLSRHIERHTIQVQRATQTLAAAQRHRQISGQFGTPGITITNTTPASPVDLSGADQSPRVPSPQNLGSHSQPADMATTMISTVPQELLTHHSLQVSSPLSPNMAAPIGPGETPLLEYMPTVFSPQPPPIPIPTPPPPTLVPTSIHPNVYILPETAQALQPGPSFSRSNDKLPPSRSTPSWDNYRWLLDQSPPDDVLASLNNAAKSVVASMVHPLESAHYVAMSQEHGIDDYYYASSPFFHTIEGNQRGRLFQIFGQSPCVVAENSSPDHFTKYLSTYWKTFHSLMPFLHRATFIPQRQPDYLVAMVLAMGASYGNAEEKRFAYAVHEIVRRWILESDEFETFDPDSLTIRQLVFLTEVFGKMRIPDGDVYNTELESILIHSLRRSTIMSDDVLEIVRGFIRDGIQFNAQTEWRTWIDLESKKRLALFVFFWDTQHSILWGRETFHSVFDVHVHVPCNGYIWAIDTAMEWVQTLEVGHAESTTFQEMLRSYIDFRREPQTPTVLGAAFSLYAFMGLGREMQHRSAANFVIPVPAELEEKHVKLLNALERWKEKLERELKAVLFPPLLDKFTIIYHLIYIRLHLKVETLLTAAGDVRFSRENEKDVYRATDEIRAWVNNTQISLTTIKHAVNILKLYFTHCEASGYKHELYIGWTAYLATLLCWAFGKFACPFEDEASNRRPPNWDPWNDKGEYLFAMGRLDTTMCRRTEGLITSVIATLEDSGWMHVQRAVQVLKSLIS